MTLCIETKTLLTYGPCEHPQGPCLHAEVPPVTEMFHEKRFACLREAASAKAMHAGVAISLKKARLLRSPLKDNF